MKHKGFTLIELLIVVAIIAILAAIAVPNFMEAQVRAKITRVQSDFRSVGTALESYMVDNNNYPIGRYGITGANRPGNDEAWYNLQDLTTPIAYISSVSFTDPFMPTETTQKGSFTYFGYDGLWGHHAAVKPHIVQAYGHNPKAWAITSYGPDRKWQAAEWHPIQMKNGYHQEALQLIYDPTNGTKSAGSLARFGGSIQVTVMGN